jgi:hypothetical protein
MFKKIFSFSNVTLVVALALSSIAAWYSIIGLAAIFAGAVVPIIIMGGALELAKITTTVWLRKYWTRCAWIMKVYLVTAVVALALLTSMGIFGFLSKAHIDQGIGTGDVSAKVSLIDERIKTERDNIEVARNALAQMDSQVNNVMNKGDSERSAERSVQIRRQQAQERGRIQKDIEIANQKIAKLNEERAPIATELRKVEAEVGPIKYIAAMIYGDNPDQNVLERAVRWVIILLVIVFDPLAIMLVIAANQSKDWDKIIWKEESEAEFHARIKDELAETLKDLEPTLKELERDASEKIIEEEKTIEEEVIEPEVIAIVEEIKVEPTEEVKQPDASYNIKNDLYGKINLNASYNIDIQKPEIDPTVLAEDEVTKFIKDVIPEYEPDDGPLTDEQLEQIRKSVEEGPNKLGQVVEQSFLIAEPTADDATFDASHNELTVDSIITVDAGTTVDSGTTVDAELTVDSVVEDIPIVETGPDYEAIRLPGGEWVQTGPQFEKKQPRKKNIKTDNVTTELFKTIGDDYVEYEGKRMHQRVLKSMRPDLFGLEEDTARKIGTDFGTAFPTHSLVGDTFVRVDTIPNRVFKFNGVKWIEINRSNSDTHLTNPEYLQHLIEKIASGEYDPDLLTENEQDAISNHIKDPTKD